MDNVRLTTGHFPLNYSSGCERAARRREREKQQPKIIKLVVTDPDTLENGGIIPASSSSLSLLRTRHFLE